MTPLHESTLDTLIAHSDHGKGPQTLREHMAGVARRATLFASTGSHERLGVSMRE